MSNPIHVSDQVLPGQIEGTLRVGARVGVIAAADLATDATTAKANVAARAASSGLHVTDQNLHTIPTQKALDKVDPVLGTGLVSGGSLNNIYDAAPGTWTEENGQFLG